MQPSHARRHYASRAGHLGTYLAAASVAVIAAIGFGCSASEEDCAKGTLLKNGVCVAEPRNDNDLPQIDELIVKYLDIAEENERPLYLLHPMNVTIGLEITGKPFKSDLVVGFSSADGTKHCAAGYLELTYAGGADAGLELTHESAKDLKSKPKASSTGEVTVTETLFVQPRCKNLIGEKKAQVWVAIDPFRRVFFAADKRLGDQPEPTAIDKLDDFLHASRWPLNFCESSFHSGHPGNCKSTMEILASPGLDARMRRVQPSSSVLTLADEETKEEGLEDAHFFANVTSVTYGAEFKKILKAYEKEAARAEEDAKKAADEGKADKHGEDGLGDYELEFYFMLRPDVTYADLPKGVSADAVDWEPLQIVEKGVVKAENGNPVLQKLLQQFLASLESAVRRQLDVPLRLPEQLDAKVRTGTWRRFSKFQLLGCLQPKAFKDAVAPGLSANNNCKIVPLIVSRHEFTDKPLGGHHKKYTVDPDTGDDWIDYKWAEDAKDPVNLCKADGEMRPKCVVLDEHLKKRSCYKIPEYKVKPVDDDCHCCYPANAFDQFLTFQHEPEIGFTLGSNESIGLRTRVWWTVHMHNKSLFEPTPLKVRTTVGFDATLVGWWTRGLLYVDTPIQLGIQPGVQSYWWPEFAVLGFTLWDTKYVIDKEDPLFEVPVIAAKEWTQNFCQTLCVQIVCFDVCAQVGASIRLEPKLTVEEAKKSLSGTLQPIAAGIAGGSVGLNLFLGVVGIKVVFDKFIAFATPIILEAQFVLEKLQDPLRVRLNGQARYDLELNALKGTISGFWTPKWGGGDQELDLYEWDGLLYVWSLWTNKRTWLIEM